MFNSEEEFFMDFKADEEDSITISATEVDSDECNSPTPPLFYKLKKARVLIKKLPRNVLAKHNMKSKKKSLSTPLPARSSGRLKDKQLPFGQYFALHVNKPLSEVLEKKKRLRLQQIKNAEKEIRDKQKNLRYKKPIAFSPNPNSSIKRSSKSIHLSRKSMNNRKTTIAGTISRPNISTRAKTNLRGRIVETSPVKAKKLIETTLPNTAEINSTTQSSLSDRRSLQEKLAATRLRCNPVTSTLHNCPDVVITRYDLPLTPQSNSRNPFIFKAPVNIPPHVSQAVPTTLGNNYTQNSINLQAVVPFGSTNFYHCQGTHSRGHAFPELISPDPIHYQMPCQSMVFNAATNTSSVAFGPPSNSDPRTFTIQAFKVPHDLSAANTPVAVDSPKVLIIKQQSSGTDPLDTSNSKTCNKILTQNLVTEREQIPSESHSDSDTISCSESESDLELSATENQNEPEVIKRIIYHTKSVQTKFTCNSSICGLIDSDEFNLNCFYCYDIFPLHKWLEFKEHVKLVHHVEEKENQSDLDAGINNYNSQNYHQLNSSRQNINVTKTMNPTISKPMNKDVTLNKGNCITKEINTTEQVFKKLPLEPRLVAKLANKTYTDPVKPLSSTSKTTYYPEKLLNQSRVFGQSSKRKLTNNKSNVYTDEIISLDDSDGCDLDIDGIDDVTTKTVVKDLQADRATSTNQSDLNNRVSRINDVNLVLPSLPHITVKKVYRTLPKESINTKKPATESSSFKEPFIKVPSNLNIRRVIKTLPKPTAQQLANNGRTRPRYFVVKKIIKLPTTQTLPNLNISQGMILKKVQESSGRDNTKRNDYDDMPSNDENEESMPKPTRGCGILFGVTNSRVVIEFLFKLKSFPALWRSQLINNVSSNYDESVKKLCFHLNSRFHLDITEIEMRRSIQRVKDWYYRMLKNIYEHKKNPNNNEPYKQQFPNYFEILQQFLTPDFQDANAILDSSQFKSNTFTKMAPQPTTLSSNTSLAAPAEIDNNQSTDKPAESLIEFDADTLYDNESSDEEVLEEFDEIKLPKKKVVPKNDGKKRTKTYLGSFECDICRKVFKRICDLKRHKVYHFPPQFECSVCSLKYHFKHFVERCSHNTNRSRYIRVDNSDSNAPKRIWPKKIFTFNLICEICGASYRSIGSLNTHKKDKHLNQRDKCVVCNFTALSNWRIVQHQRKRHIVEPGTVEEVAKKSRARTDTKTPFSNEARQEFDWRREMRKKLLKPGEKFFGCCKCRIIFNSRKEKVLHNKIEHPITEFTVICLLCLPNTKMLLSNSNSVRRHYADIHKVAWHEIDGLVKRTKPIFNLLSKEEIELLKASANYKELLEELLKDKKLEPAKNVQTLEDETFKAVENLPTSMAIKELEEELIKIDVECPQEENVYVDGIIDHDYICEDTFNKHEYASNNEHNYIEEKEIQNYEEYDGLKTELYSQNTSEDEIVHLPYDIESNDSKIHNYIPNDQFYVQSIDYDLVEGELVEESIVVEEYIDEVIEEE